MGDARYYTYTQFYNVLFFMTYIMMLTGIIISVYYRNKNTRRINYIIGIFVISFVMILSRFIEEVTYIREVGAYMRILSCIGIVFILGCIINIFMVNRGKWQERIGMVYSGMPLLYIVVSGKSIILLEYFFVEVIYANLYIYYLIFGCALLAVVFVTTKTKMDSIGEIVFSIVVTLPIFIYVIERVFERTVEVHYYVSFISTIIIYIIVLNDRSLQVISKIFDNIEKHLEEVIIVTNDNGVIVQSNIDEEKFQQLFGITKKIDRLKPYKIFAHKLIKSVIKDELYEVKVMIKEEVRTFTIKIHELRNTKKRLGFLLIIKEITEISNMLLELTNSNITLANINKELTDYSEVIYSYETEKGINDMMSEINEHLGHQIIELSLVTQKACNEVKLNSELSEQAIDDVMILAKKNLQEVRNTVTKYKSVSEEEIK